MTGPALPDAHHVARYCPPRRTENGLPHAAAFRPRVGEGYISVNWLEFFGERDAAANIEHVRAAVGKKLRLSRHGLFAVLNVGAARAAIIGAELCIEHMPTDGDPSHAGIHTRESLDIAVELRALVAASGDVHPAVRCRLPR
jgi:hypothetical protein